MNTPRGMDLNSFMYVSERIAEEIAGGQDPTRSEHWPAFQAGIKEWREWQAKNSWEFVGLPQSAVLR